MQKGIVLFDIRDFLYQGFGAEQVDVEEINQLQSQALDILHTQMWAERDRRLASNTPVPTVDIFLQTGDGYYLLCEPSLGSILDISRCIMAILKANGIGAYCVAHVGEINVFTDMTGRENATGFDLGMASRLQSLAKVTGRLVCSEGLVGMWEPNEYFNLSGDWSAEKAKDDVEYKWQLAEPIDFADYCGKFVPD